MRSSISRRGLYDIDGQQLDEARTRAAYFGSVIDTDTIRLAVADMVNNICGDDISKICLEYCLEDGYWPPDWWSEARRYADAIVADWKRYGTPSLMSLHDVCQYTISDMREIGSRLPLRRLPPSQCFVGGIIGNGPKSIYPASPAPPYTLGEGHRMIPDGLTHPLIHHLASDEPCALKPVLNDNLCSSYMPHYKSGCGLPSGPRTYPMADCGHARYYYGSDTAQNGKVALIYKLVADVKPEYASLYETGGRHALLMCGDDIDVASVCIAADKICGRFKTPLACMISDGAALDDLMGDTDGNDAHLVVRCGRTLAGEDPRSQKTLVPRRPAAFTKDDMLHNMERHGFELIGSMPKPCGMSIRPEYVITATHFSMEPRWLIAGVAVMLCACKINWRLLLYLADAYGYAGTLYGVVDSLCRQGRDFRRPSDVWRRRGIQMVVTEDDTIRKALRTYGC